MCQTDSCISLLFYEQPIRNTTLHTHARTHKNGQQQQQFFACNNDRCQFGYKPLLRLSFLCQSVQGSFRWQTRNMLTHTQEGRRRIYPQGTQSSCCKRHVSRSQDRSTLLLGSHNVKLKYKQYHVHANETFSTIGREREEEEEESS